MKSVFLSLVLVVFATSAQAQPSASGNSAGASMLQPAPASVSAPSADVLASDGYKALIADLRRGGYVIYLRHALTAAKPEPSLGDLSDCSWQRNLSDDGRRQARAIGAWLVEQGIAVVEVEASPFCRTRETAALTFGRDAKVNQQLLYHTTQSEAEVDAANGRLKARLGKVPASGNLALVGHSPTMKAAGAVELPEGQAAIVKPEGPGSFRVVARLTEAGITPVP
ncbi:MAG: hypothetical protein EPO67_12865 [Reyranella sp.]|nr:MAG: hypothetical protein EPO67_12865 [Reyranella sp.]